MTEKIDQTEAELLAAMGLAGEQTEYKAVCDTPLTKEIPIASKEEIIEAIRQVYDPEIPINVYDMGLIYAVDIQKNGNILIDMTLTAPGCPVAGILPQQVAEAVCALEGTGVVEVKIVWEPQWTIERMTQEGRAMMDLF